VNTATFERLPASRAIPFIITSPVLISGISYAGNTCVSDSSISLDKVEKALKPIVGNAKPVSVNASPVDNLYEVILEVNGRKIPVYVDCSLNYLITGEIIDIKNKKSITREKVAQLKKEEAKKVSKQLEQFLGKEKLEKLKNVVGEVALASFSVVSLDNIPEKGIVVYGSKNPELKIVVITDPQCPFCKRLHESMKEVLKEENVSFELVMYPLPFHQYAQGLSEAVVCQKSNKDAQRLLDEIFKKQKDTGKLKEISTKHKCSEGQEIVEKHKEFAKSVKVGGTPTMIFVIAENKGLKISGAYPPEKLKQIIDALK